MNKFLERHLGPSAQDTEEMLSKLGFEDLESFSKEVIPKDLYLQNSLNLPSSVTEIELLQLLKNYGQQNHWHRSFLGQGFYSTHVPSVIQRNIFENPAWYTSYTPYQAEISQGRLEALFHFQTLVTELTALPITNASLLDEGSALAEAVNVAFQHPKRNKEGRKKLYVHPKVSVYSLDVLNLRVEPFGIKIERGSAEKISDEHFAVVLPYPAEDGEIFDPREIIEKAKQHTCTVIMVTDLLALTLLCPPGELGVDIAVGSSQRFGVPMGFGGPSAAFFATKEEFKRQVPGRIVGLSKDSKSNVAYRLSLQVREQHIRREKATSNICTAQALLAVMAGMYGIYHGPKGLRQQASNIHKLCLSLSNSLEKVGVRVQHGCYFDTLKLGPFSKKELLLIEKRAALFKYNLRYFDDRSIGVSLDEKSDVEEVKRLFFVLSKKEINTLPLVESDALIAGLSREGEFLQQKIFNEIHSETQMLRYIKKLELKDISLVHSMIPLGSCSMKLNSTVSLQALSWDAFSDVHPFAPKDQVKGYLKIIEDLEFFLCEITGFSSCSLQPNSGAQGELTALLVLKRYFSHTGQKQRNKVLIPVSAHGTNPASAALAGFEVIPVACKDSGDIDLEDLKNSLKMYKDEIAVFMLTYPSTHGVFEEGIKELCKLVHESGGQVYLDGANLNAQVALTSISQMGADICHLNLHKTFSIPHGGGGPGVGPILCKKHLEDFFPNHLLYQKHENGIPSPCSTPFGSASILLISYAYIRLLGADGLKHASQIAILNANYMKKELMQDFSILYTGKKGLVAHELILDLRELKEKWGVTVEDIARRLMDFGFHAPTISWPVIGTVMIEPTESENKEEMDRFCLALKHILKEVRGIEEGKYSKDNNPVKNAPHTLVDLEDWSHSYSIKEGCFPLKYLSKQKMWPNVNAIDHAWGDRNLICACPKVLDYAQ
ncbi:Glycine dehydrogenase (decarboxylating) [Chlamydiales bacterium SCGC AB-751-O23]|jgi:glycine dehydrogenase|nr:Glycine dehydrogenase (decarboxylating) [Chlamydiales bacterium SCGC AB-751-O23]